MNRRRRRTAARPGLGRRLGGRWAGGAAIGVIVVVVAWFVFRMWPVTAPTGVRLGRLPGGVHPGDLNVLLITLDTTRADRLGAYGFKAIETPALDRIAREGVLFEHAVAPAPLTLPAHSSLFTSKLPPAHGVRDNGGFFLNERETTMAERLKSRGFRTGGFVGAYVLDHKWGISAGVREILRQLQSLQVSQRLPQQRRATRRRSRGPCARVARQPCARRSFSRGSTFTTRIRPTIRPSRTSPATLIVRTPAKSPSSTPRSAA